MSASRSWGSTSAPHLTILSISRVQAALLKRCCTMMRASWQLKHAAAAFSCKGPAGNSSFGDDAAAAILNAQIRATVRTLPLSLNIDLHLIVGVVKISARIPDGRVGLNPSLAVGGAREDHVVAAFRRLPGIAPQTPCVLSVILAEFRRSPGGA